MKTAEMLYDTCESPEEFLNFLAFANTEELEKLLRIIDYHEKWDDPLSPLCVYKGLIRDVIAGRACGSEEGS